MLNKEVKQPQERAQCAVFGSTNTSNSSKGLPLHVAGQGQGPSKVKEQLPSMSQTAFGQNRLQIQQRNVQCTF